MRPLHFPLGVPCFGGPGDLNVANTQQLGEIEVRDNGKLLSEMLAQLRDIPQR